MSRKAETIAALMGAALALAFVVYFIVYVPMAENVRLRGCPFLVCSTPTQTP